MLRTARLQHRHQRCHRRVRQASRRTMAWGPVSGCGSNRFRRASSISRIWLTTKPSRAMSRCSSAKVFGGSGMPSGVCRVARRSAALRRVGLKLRMPSRARVHFIRVALRWLNSPLLGLDKAAKVAKGDEDHFPRPKPERPLWIRSTGLRQCQQLGEGCAKSGLWTRGSVDSEQQRNFGDTRQEVGVRGPA
jgi:hypothetical protein